MENKFCRKCDTVKSMDDFYKNKSAKDGYGAYCKTCHSADMQKYYSSVDITIRNRWVRYKVTPEIFDAMLASQEGKCAICRGHSSRWHIDHDHRCCAGDKTCGKCVRAILCASCNLALGLLEREPDFVQKMLAYVAFYK